MDKHACSNGSVWRRSLYQATHGAKRSPVFLPLSLNNATIRALSTIAKYTIGNKSHNNCTVSTQTERKYTEMQSNADSIGHATWVHSWKRGHGNCTKMWDCWSLFSRTMGLKNGRRSASTSREEHKMLWKTGIHSLWRNRENPQRTNTKLSWKLSMIIWKSVMLSNTPQINRRIMWFTRSQSSRNKRSVVKIPTNR